MISAIYFTELLKHASLSCFKKNLILIRKICDTPYQTIRKHIHIYTHLIIICNSKMSYFTIIFLIL